MELSALSVIYHAVERVIQYRPLSATMQLFVISEIAYAITFVIHLASVIVVVVSSNLYSLSLFTGRSHKLSFGRDSPKKF